MTSARIGDIIEIRTSKGLAYAQYTHQHRRFGGLIRVFEGFSKEMPQDLEKLVSSPIQFSIFFPVRAAVQRGLVRVVGWVGIPVQNRMFPVFRDGITDPATKKVAVWWLWDGEKEWKIGSSLTPDQKKIPIREIVNDTMLIQRIEQGWRPENNSD